MPCSRLTLLFSPTKSPIDKIANHGWQRRKIAGILASGPSYPRFEISVSEKNLEKKIVYVAEVNQWHCSEKNGQWLKNVD